MNKLIKLRNEYANKGLQFQYVNKKKCHFAGENP